MTANSHWRPLAPYLTSLALCCAAGLSFGGRTIRATDRDPRPEPRGVTYSASLSKTEFQREKPIRLELRFRNSMKEPVTIWLSGFWPNHQVIVTDETGVEPPLTPFGKTARDAFAPGGGRDKNSPVVLMAGDVYQEKTDVDLARLYHLGPGRYRVDVTYYDLQAPTPMRLTTATLPFEIRR